MSLIVWLIAAVLSLGGCLCYLDLATMIPEAGGDWTYLRVGFGGAPAFISAWTGFFLTGLSGSLTSLISAEYMLAPFFSSCGIPVSLLKSNQCQLQDLEDI